MAQNARYLKIFGQIMTMMGRRGFDVSNNNTSDFTPDHFGYVFQEWSFDNPTEIQQELIDRKHTSTWSMMSQILTKKDDEKEKCIIYFADVFKTSQVSGAEIQILSQLYLKFECTSGIIITTTVMSSQAGGLFRELAALSNIQHYRDHQLTYDPTESIWASEWIPTTPEQNAKVLENVKASQMPRISTEDAIAKYHGAKPGDVMKFLRDNFLPEMLCDKEIFYRYVYRPGKETAKKR